MQQRKRGEMFCGHCGAAVMDSQRFCSSCGKPIAEGSDPPDHIQQSADRAPQIAARHEPTAVFAGFWRRVGAWGIDYFVIMLPAALLTAAITIVNGTSSQGVAVVLMYVLLPWLYYSLLESSRFQGTLGKLVFAIKVTAIDGSRISFGHATGRHIAKVLSVLTLNVGFVMAAFTERRQALHDKVAKTLVVRRQFLPDEIAIASPAPKISAGLATLVVVCVLLFGPFGIGILAAIAIPAYQDYTIRTQVVEGLNAASAYRVAVATALSNGMDAATIQTAALGVAQPQSEYVEAIEVNSGVVVVHFGGRAHAVLAGETLDLVPGLDSAGRLTWRCGYDGGAPGARFLTERSDWGTTIPERYLPHACRSSARQRS